MENRIGEADWCLPFYYHILCMEKQRDDEMKDREMVMDVYTDDTDFIPISMLCIENTADPKFRLRIFFRDRSHRRTNKKAKKEKEDPQFELPDLFGRSKYTVFDASLIGEIIKQRFSDVNHPISCVAVAMLMGGNDYIDGLPYTFPCANTVHLDYYGVTHQTLLKVFIEQKDYIENLIIMPREGETKKIDFTSYVKFMRCVYTHLYDKAIKKLPKRVANILKRTSKKPRKIVKTTTTRKKKVKHVIFMHI